jgi:hypothetical protein
MWVWKPNPTANMCALALLPGLNTFVIVRVDDEVMHTI